MNSVYPLGPVETSDYSARKTSESNYSGMTPSQVEVYGIKNCCCFLD